MDPEEHFLSKGFTIVESLVVILVIILLVSIVVPGLMGRVGEEPKLPVPVATATDKPTVADPAPTEDVEGSAGEQAAPGTGPHPLADE